MPETTPHPPEVPQIQAAETLEPTAEQKGLVSHAKALLRKIQESFSGGRSAEQVDGFVSELVDEANDGKLGSSEVTLVDATGAEEIAEMEGRAEHTAGSMAGSSDERLGATLDTVAAVEGLPTAGVVAQAVAEARRSAELKDFGLSWKALAEFKRIYQQMDESELIDKYRSGDSAVVSLIEETSRMAIIASHPDYVYIHSRALTALEAVHGSALKWQKSDTYTTNLPSTAEYANNPWLPSLYFMRSWNAYQSELAAWKNNPDQHPQFDHEERVQKLMTDFRDAIWGALQIERSDDPVRGVARKYLYGNLQSQFTLDEQSHKMAPNDKYLRSGFQYLENICALGREGVQKIHSFTKVVNFDRYSFSMLSLAQRVAERDPRTIQRLNEQGATFLITGQDGDPKMFLGPLAKLTTVSTIPFEVDDNVADDQEFDWILDSSDDAGLKNIKHVTFGGHMGPSGVFWITGNSALTSELNPGTATRLRARLKRIRGNNSIRRLILAIRPDAAGNRNLSLASCNGVVRPEDGILSVAEEFGNIDPSVRLETSDGELFLNTPHPMIPLHVLDTMGTPMDGTLDVAIMPGAEEAASDNRLRILQRRKQRYNVSRPVTIVSGKPRSSRPGLRRGSSRSQPSVKRAKGPASRKMRIGY